MPYKLRKAPNRDLYWVVARDGKKMSKNPIPKERAKRQIKALYASESRRLRGGNIESDIDMLKDEIIEKLGFNQAQNTFERIRRQANGNLEEELRFLQIALMETNEDYERPTENITQNRPYVPGSAAYAPGYVPGSAPYIRQPSRGIMEGYYERMQQERQREAEEDRRQAQLEENRRLRNNFLNEEQRLEIERQQREREEEIGRQMEESRRRMRQQDEQLRQERTRIGQQAAEIRRQNEERNLANVQAILEEGRQFLHEEPIFYQENEDPREIRARQVGNFLAQFYTPGPLEPPEPSIPVNTTPEELADLPANSDFTDLQLQQRRQFLNNKINSYRTFIHELRTNYLPRIENEIAIETKRPRKYKDIVEDDNYDIGGVKLKDDDYVIVLDGYVYTPETFLNFIRTATTIPEYDPGVNPNPNLIYTNGTWTLRSPFRQPIDLNKKLDIRQVKIKKRGSGMFAIEF